MIKQRHVWPLCHLLYFLNLYIETGSTDQASSVPGHGLPGLLSNGTDNTTGV